MLSRSRVREVPQFVHIKCMGSSRIVQLPVTVAETAIQRPDFMGLLMQARKQSDQPSST